MRWQTSDTNTNRDPEIVAPGYYEGTIQFADENEKHNKIRCTVDLDGGQRVRFNIGPRKGASASVAIGKSDSHSLEAGDLVGKRVGVKLDQWSPEDDPNRVFNTLKDISKPLAAEGFSTKKGKVDEIGETNISSDDIPF